VRGSGLLQIGTVIEGATEWKTARLTKKQRRATIADELLADAGLRGYAKGKFLNIQEEKKRGRKQNSDKLGKHKDKRKSKWMKK
jgi:Fcf2 pre-rRNA processing